MSIMITPNYNYPPTLVPTNYDAVTDFTYDASGNMLTCTFRSGGIAGTAIANLTFTYDANGNMLTVVRG